MAHNLITLLGGSSADELALQELRSIARDGVDVRLIADILARAHQVMRRLGLDPSDTTPEEVYGALLGSVKTDQWQSLLDDTEYVLLEIKGTVISFNPIDVIDSYHYELPIENRRMAAAKRGLGWEITRRYKSHPQTNDSRVNNVADRVNWPTEEPQFCRIVFEKPSILTVGDIATEALITIAEGDIEETGDKDNQKISLALGARIAAESAEVQDAVGGAANAAVAFSKLGVQPSLVSWLGDDTVGRQSLEYLRRHGIDMSGVKLEKNKRSNYHYVLRHKAERTIIAQYEEFNYRWPQPVCQPDWVYLSMISGQSWVIHEELLNYLDENESVKLAFQPGAAHLSWGRDKLSALYSRSAILIMNVDEAMSLTESESRSIDPLLVSLHKLGPNIVVITDGPSGAYAYDGETVFQVPAYPDPASPIDRTGAGDAFASSLVALLARELPIEEALRRAPVNAMSVVQHLGAQTGLLSDNEIIDLLESAPDTYQVSTRQPSLD